MDLSQAIDIKNVIVALSGSDKASVISQLVKALVESGKISNFHDIYEQVMERERVRSTGVGKGFAIPHCKTSAVDKVHIAFGICVEAIPFDSIDGEPVKLIALLISPSSQTGAHIQALAGISRIITSVGVREKLYEINNPETSCPWTAQEVYNLITSRL